jgi:hypothetical protein
MSTIEEASKCPRCGAQGFNASMSQGRRGSKVYTYTCQNDTCSWYKTGWVVQVNADGTIPERQAGPKEHPKPDSYAEAIAKKQIEDLAAAGDVGAQEFLRKN